MCFSATASFGASTLLLGIGVVSMKNTISKDQKILYAIPLIFSIQQFVEGLLWIFLGDETNLKLIKILGLNFLLIAQVLWPIFIPYAILRNEIMPKRKKALSAFLILGIIHGLYFGYGLISYPISVEVVEAHILYKMEFKASHQWYAGIFYILATGISPFYSSIKNMNFIGIIILSTYIISFLFYRDFIITVWCYFATLISIIILIISLQFNRLKK